MHAVHADAAVALEYAPAAHAVQPVAPAGLLYVPAPHAVHTDAAVAAGTLL